MVVGVLVVRQVLLAPVLAHRCSVLDLTPVRLRLQLWYETRQLSVPVVQCRGRRDDEKRAPDVVLLRQVGEQRDRLDGLRICQ